MPGLLAISLAFSPGLFWLWYFYHKGVYQPQPKGLVLRAFILGMLATVPAGILEWVLLPEDILQTTRPATFAMANFLIIGPVEELSKYLAVRLGPYRSRYFSEPIDGIIYAAAVALGFASLENLGYMLNFGWKVILVRGPVSTLAHVLFSAPWGYALGITTLRGRARASIGGMLLGSMLLHGAFNFLLFTHSLPMLLLIPLMVGTGVWLRGRIAWAQATSPSRGRLTHLFVRCGHCSYRMQPFYRFCTNCGASLLPQPALTLHCGHCSAVNREESLYCASCGYRLLRNT
ncbi:MAG: PrsW family intramembrane metalloprotease [Chloroflexi bacterium]|nr:PrsW family intramembrane metalloprotease [Chloroflexota bacterium]